MSNFGQLQLSVQLGLIAICVSSMCYFALSYKTDNMTLRNTARNDCPLAGNVLNAFWRVIATVRR